MMQHQPRPQLAVGPSFNRSISAASSSFSFFFFLFCAASFAASSFSLFFFLFAAPDIPFSPFFLTYVSLSSCRVLHVFYLEKKGTF